MTSIVENAFDFARTDRGWRMQERRVFNFQEVNIEAKPEQIDKASLARVFAAANVIDTLIIGTGTDVWLPSSELREALRAVKVVLDTMQTGPAIRTYNIMLGERRRVAAALIAVS